MLAEPQFPHHPRKGWLGGLSEAGALLVNSPEALLREEESERVSEAGVRGGGGRASEETKCITTGILTAPVILPRLGKARPIN